MDTPPADPYSPYVYGAPADFDYTIDQGNDVTPWVGVIAIVTKFIDGVKHFWNGSTFVEYAEFGWPSDISAGSSTTVPEGAINAVSPAYGQWTATLPFSVMGSGDYDVSFYYSTDQARGYTYSFPKAHGRVKARGAQSPNPDGVTVNSDFGGTDALRITKSDNSPIAGVYVTATVTTGGITYTRATTTTDSNGRWTFPVVLQPLTSHTLTLTKAGFVTRTTTITTGAAA